MSTGITRIDTTARLINPALNNTAGPIDNKKLFDNYNLSDYETNSQNNSFLKEYLEGKAIANRIAIPEGMKINISSYKFEDKYTKILHKNERIWSGSHNSAEGIRAYCEKEGLSEEETQKTLNLYRFHDVRVNIFGARISDMFKLLAQDKDSVAARVAEMQISDENKNEIIQLKNFFDKYYKVEAEYNGRTFDLLHLDDESKAELTKISPEFSEFIQKEQQELNKHTINFAQKEMKAFELSEAGNDSRKAATLLAAILTGNIGIGVFNSFKTKKELVMSQKFMDFVKNNPQKGKEILDKCVIKFNKIGEEEKAMEVISRYMKKIGMEGGQHFVKSVAIYGKGKLPGLVNPLKAVKGKGFLGLIPIILLTLQGSADDCMGAVKDFVQDQNNFGTSTAGKIAIGSVLGGIASSFAIAPTMDEIINFKRAEKMLIKNGFIEKLQGAAKYKRMGKTAFLGALFGMLVASSSSGSSWTSMILTRLKFGQNGKELVKKNVITKEDNTFKSTNANMMEYEAYSGKAKGITFGDFKTGVLTGDWTIGSVGGALGLFTSPYPVLQSLCFGLQGCSETLTACGYQLAGNAIRDNQLDKEKQALVESVRTNCAI